MRASSSHTTFVGYGLLERQELNNYYPHKTTPRKDQETLQAMARTISGSVEFKLRFVPLQRCKSSDGKVPEIFPSFAGSFSYPPPASCRCFFSNDFSLTHRLPLTAKCVRLTTVLLGRDLENIHIAFQLTA